MIMVRIFARLREQLGRSSIELERPPVSTPAQLVEWLAERHGPRWRELLTDPKIIVAINQEVAGWQSRLGDGDEVAFFPPVTGG